MYLAIKQDFFRLWLTQSVWRFIWPSIFRKSKKPFDVIGRSASGSGKDERTTEAAKWGDVISRIPTGWLIPSPRTSTTALAEGGRIHRPKKNIYSLVKQSLFTYKHSGRPVQRWLTPSNRQQFQRWYVCQLWYKSVEKIGIDTDNATYLVFFHLLNRKQLWKIAAQRKGAQLWKKEH